VRRLYFNILSALAQAFDVNLFRFPQFSAVFALRNWSAFLLYFKQWAVGVLA
jgi:hypothetical protein